MQRRASGSRPTSWQILGKISGPRSRWIFPVWGGVTSVTVRLPEIVIGERVRDRGPCRRSGRDETLPPRFEQELMGCRGLVLTTALAKGGLGENKSQKRRYVYM